MASTSTALSLPSTSTLVDTKVHRQSTTLSSLQCSGLPMEPSQNRALINKDNWRSAAYCRKLVRNVVTMAAGDMPALVTEDVPTVTSGEVPSMPSGDVPDVPALASGDVPDVPALASVDVPAAASGDVPTLAVGTELPDIVKTVQAAWDKLEDKYAVSSLAVAGLVALAGANGMISAIDRLPLVPGALELVGIGYSGWFAYKNLIFKPQREALLQKITGTFKEIIGTS